MNEAQKNTMELMMRCIQAIEAVEDREKNVLSIVVDLCQYTSEIIEEETYVFDDTAAQMALNLMNEWEGKTRDLPHEMKPLHIGIVAARNSLAAYVAFRNSMDEVTRYMEKTIAEFEACEN